MKRAAAYLVLLALLWNLLAGCVVKVHARDPLTIANIDATAQHRAKDAEATQRALARAAQLAPNDDERAYFRFVSGDLAAVEKAEQARLKSWRWREEQKAEAAP